MSISYRQLYEEGLCVLQEKIPENPDIKLDARLLLEEVCGTTMETLLVYPDLKVEEEKAESYLEMIRRRSLHEPVAYILGKQDFMGLPFKVTRDVLIPNQDTENLTEEALKEVHDGMKILDLCTGSGCILLSLLHYSNGTVGVGTDLSDAALKAAEENGSELGLSGRVQWLKGDLFDALKGDEKFEIIVSNPPYIPTKVIDTLMPEVAKEEPFMALDGGEDGLTFYRKIVEMAGSYLVRGGVLLLETGFDEAADIARMMEEKGYIGVKIYKDYGGQDRVVRGEWTYAEFNER